MPTVRFSSASWLLLKLNSKFLSVSKPVLYVLHKDNKSNWIYRWFTCRTRQHSPQNLKELFDKPTCIPIIRFPFFFLYRKQDGNTGGSYPKTQESQLTYKALPPATDPVAWGSPPSLVVTVTPLLVKVTQINHCGIPLTIFIPHTVEAFLNSH